MPLAHHVCAVASSAQDLGDGGRAKRQGVGLGPPDDLVLQPRVDLLHSTSHESEDYVYIRVIRSVMFLIFFTSLLYF